MLASAAMSERVLKCPQCSAPLRPPSRFARSTVCPYCSATVLIDPAAVSAARYHAARIEWEDSARHGFENVCHIRSGAWAIGRRLGGSDRSDVFAAVRARWPTERAVVKVLRSINLAGFDHEWEVLSGLQSSDAAGADSLRHRLPGPIAHGVILDGLYAGRSALVLEWAHGFHYTLDDARTASRRGIAPAAAPWLWRRILEALSLVHRSGYVHGAVVPAHVLIETGEHGARLIGFGRATRAGKRLDPPSASHPITPFVPPGARASIATPQLDIEMSARCVVWALGGDPKKGEMSAWVPEPFAQLLRAAIASGVGDAWTWRERIGTVAVEAFGPPAFHPIKLPD